MKFRFINIASAVLVSLAVLSSCKKDDDTKEYLSGTLEVEGSIPNFVKPGEKYSFKPSGITAPDGTAVGYYFSAPVTGVKDTLKNGRDTFLYEVPDSIGSFSLTCVAYPIESSDKYYVSSSSVSFVVVRDGYYNGSITNVTHDPSDSRVTIDGRYYYAGKAGGKEWLRSNLSVVRRDSDGNEVFGRSFHDCAAMQNVFGAYYTWEEAITACPDGWHLPTGAEWVELLKSVGAPESLRVLEDSPCGAGKLMVKSYFNGQVMWDYYRGVDITNTCLSAMPVGYCEIASVNAYLGYSDYAVFWNKNGA